MILRQLEYFCAVVRTGSFTKAAEEFGVSQSAISQQIRSLEDHLRVALLARNGRHFTVTDEGRFFAERAESALGAIDKAVFDVRCLASGSPGKLSFGYLNRYDGWEVQGAVAAFARRHPQVDILVQSDSHDGLYGKLLSGEIDIAFNDRRRSLSSEFFNVHLARSYRYVEVSEASPAAWRSSVTPQDMRGQRCILIAPEEQRLVEAAYYRDALTFADDFDFVRTLDEARMMVAGNKGFLATEAREEQGRTGTVIRSIPLFDSDGHMQVDYYAFWRKDRTNDLIEEFARILEDLFQAS